MTANELRAWQEAMAYTQEQAAVALGINRVSFAKLVGGMVPIDRRTALACAAIAAGIDEWKPPRGAQVQRRSAN